MSKILEQYQQELAAFEAKYPKYCRQCGATGVISYTENGAPHGEGFWPMPMTDVCPACVEDGRCPLCGEDLPEEQYDTGEDFRCPACGWVEGKAGQPTPPPVPGYAEIDYSDSLEEPHA